LNHIDPRPRGLASATALGRSAMEPASVGVASQRHRTAIGPKRAPAAAWTPGSLGPRDALADRQMHTSRDWT